MPKTSKKDPRYPKKNANVYLMYQNEMRDTFKARKPEMDCGKFKTLLFYWKPGRFLGFNYVFHTID
jgi:hypothetical protein